MRLWKLAVLGLVTLSLSSCFLADRGVVRNDVAIREADSGLEILFCRDVGATFVRMEERLPGAAWVPFVDYDGLEIDISTGQVVTLGDQTVFPERGEPALGPGAEIAIQLGHDDRAVVDSYFTVPPGGLSTDRWLRVDGVLSATPCE